MKTAKEFPKPVTAHTHLTRAFKHRNFRLFFGGQIISVIGTWMQMVAQSWLVYSLSHSAFYLGLVGFAGQIPIFAFSTFAGVWVDHFSKRRMILLTQTLAMVQAFALAFLVFSHSATIWNVAVLAVLLGFVNSFDMPARQAFMVEMVGRDDLMNAIALNSSMVNGARIIGPAIAGALVASVGEGYCFLINGASYIAVLIGLVAMRVPPHVRPAGSAGMMTRFKEGLDYIHKTTPVKTLLILLGIVSLIGMPYSVLMPVFADKVLHCDPGTRCCRTISRCGS